MPITNFALDFKHQFVFNYDQMLETHKALCARVSSLIAKNMLDSDEMKTTLAVASMLNAVIEEAVLEYEKQYSQEQAKILDNDQEVQKFLNDDNY
jgi:hypothetical protein